MEKETLEKIQKTLKEIGWSIAIPKEGELDHLVIGELETIEEMVEDYDYEIMSPPTVN